MGRGGATPVEDRGSGVEPRGSDQGPPAGVVGVHSRAPGPAVLRQRTVTRGRGVSRPASAGAHRAAHWRRPGAPRPGPPAPRPRRRLPPPPSSRRASRAAPAPADVFRRT